MLIGLLILIGVITFWMRKRRGTDLQNQDGRMHRYQLGFRQNKNLHVGDKLLLPVSVQGT